MRRRAAPPSTTWPRRSATSRTPTTTIGDVNVGGTLNVLAAARAHGCERLVHCSTGGVHGHIDRPPADETYRFKPGDVYQRTKLEAELAATAAAKEGLPVSIVRPGAIYGEGDMRFLRLFRAIQQQPIRDGGLGPHAPAHGLRRRHGARPHARGLASGRARRDVSHRRCRSADAERDRGVRRRRDGSAAAEPARARLAGLCSGAALRSGLRAARYRAASASAPRRLLHAPSRVRHHESAPADLVRAARPARRRRYAAPRRGTQRPACWRR